MASAPTESRRPAPLWRYAAPARWLHWGSAILMLAVVILGWIMESLPDEAASRGTVLMLHKSVGLTILAVTAIRLIWRARHPPPPSGRWGAWEAAAAALSHWLLYLVLLAMPASGYLMSAGHARRIPFFGLVDIPLLVPADETVYSIGHTVHILGQWAVYGLVLLHVAATVWHIAIRRDGTLDRMLPEQTADAGLYPTRSSPNTSATSS